MGTVISTIAAVIIAAVLAVIATLGIVSSQTKAPSINPAGQVTVNYGG